MYCKVLVDCFEDQILLERTTLPLPYNLLSTMLYVTICNIPDFMILLDKRRYYFTYYTRTESTQSEVREITTSKIA